MSESKSVFAGSIPEAYHRYLVPLIFEEYAQDLASRAMMLPSGTVLETACGTGVLTKHLRAVLPRTVKIVATDLNRAMLEVARAELDGLEAIEYQTADGTALPFEDDTFDIVVCQFGVMFFPDKELGYREAARVLKPGGAFVFNVWDSLVHNRFAERVHDTVVELFPDNPPVFLSLPYGYNDPSEIKMQLQHAGFTDIHFSVLPRASRAPSAREAALAFTAGSPLAAQLAERGIEEAALEAAEAALVDAFGRGDVAAPMQAIVIVANAADIR